MASEFGKGMVTCLVKWAAHLDRYLEMKERYKIMNIDKHYDTLWCMWISGASDHLYEIEVPDGKEWDVVREKIKYLRSESFLYRYDGVKSQEEADDMFFEFRKLTFEVAVEIDKVLGINADVGEWE